MGLNKRLISAAAAAGGVVNTENFAPVTYTGNGSTQSISTVGFQPDLVWLKSRETTRNHMLSTSVQQQYNYLSTNLTNAEATSSARITSLDSNGFTVGSSANVNENNTDYVAWCWKAGGAAVSNTEGSITSQVSANPDAGFSIVKYTGNGTAGSTIGHGLSSAPEMIISKNLDITSHWRFGSNDLGWTKYMNISTNAEAVTSNIIWNDTAPTSTVFEVGSNSSVIGNGNDIIAYCFHSVDGYQKIGTYAGTSYTQNDISLSFAPRFVMVKNTTSSAGWYIFDLSRDVANGNGRYLEANSSAVESNIGNGMIFLSNGFRWKDQPDNKFNASGQTYIYLAIA